MIRRFIVFFYCLFFISNLLYAQAPIINSFSPSSGMVGASITLTGSNFNAAANNNLVFFGTTKGTVKKASTNQLVVTVPVGSSYQPIEVLNTATGLSAFTDLPFITTFQSKHAINSGDFVLNAKIVDRNTPRSFATGDIDGDGKPDLVVIYPTDSVVIYRNISTNGNVVFAPPISFATGGQPTNVQIADMDGDGKPEIIVFNSYDSSIWVYHNVSVAGNIDKNSLSGITSFDINSSTAFISIADIDGDGKPDLILTPSTVTDQEAITIVQNTSSPGAISFGDEAFLEPTENTTAVIVTDIDGDGKPDIITCDGLNTFSIFRNVYNGGNITGAAFAARQDIKMPFTFTSFAVGDLNSDNKADVALLGTYSGEFIQGDIAVFTLLNTSVAGSITFKMQGSNAVAAGNTVALADMDGDGKPDIVVNGRNDVTVVRNRSTTGSLIFSPNADIATGQGYGHAVVADIDGDGKPDLISMSQSSNQFNIFLNQPTPLQTFPAAPEISKLSVTAAPYYATIQITGQNFAADASSNHVVFGATAGQVINASATSLTVKVPPGSTFGQVSALNLTTGLTAASGMDFIPTLKPPQTLNAHSYSAKSYLNGQDSFITDIADINGDGIPDLISLVGSGSTTGFSVYAGIKSTKSFSYASGIEFADAQHNYSGLAVADIDGDGKPDIILSGRNMGFTVFLNTSTSAHISFAPGVYVNLGIDAGNVAIADIDGDGKPDIAIAIAGGVSFLLNESTQGVVSFLSQTPIDTGTSFWAIYLKDIDMDGKPDLIVSAGGGDSTHVYIFLNQSVKGGVAFSHAFFAFLGLGPRAIGGVADMDGDGKPDIVSVTDPDNYGEGLDIIRNTSSPGNISFSQPQVFLITSATGITNKSMTIADINGDGKPDVVVGIVGSSLPLLSQGIVMINSSTVGNFNMNPPIVLNSDPSPLSVSVADLDGDGKPEILFDRVSDAAYETYGGLEFFTNSNLDVFTSPYTTIYDPKAGKPVAIDTAVTVQTRLAFTLKQATVSITQNFKAAEDSLEFIGVPSKTGDITSSYNSGTGVLLLASSSATIEQLQNALQSVTYKNSNSTRPDTNTRTVSFLYTNGTDTSNTALKYIRVEPGTLTGFPLPIITPNGPTAFLQGDSVILQASPSVGYAYQWARNGSIIQNASYSTYTAKLGGSYTVSISANGKTAVSDSVKVLTTLPAENFKLSIVSATCDGAADGAINIVALKNLNYTAAISGNDFNDTYQFTTSVNINNLTAGTYSVCITVADQPDYRQCFSVIINQPAPLSVYSTVDLNNKTVKLHLNGGSEYNININGTYYTTADSTITLSLMEGSNDLIVSTDKFCQGAVERLINISGSITPYPVPFQNTLNINLGLNNVNKVAVEIHDLSTGNLVFQKKFVNQSGVLQLDLASLSNGVYALYLSMDQLEKAFKITKQ